MTALFSGSVGWFIYASALISNCFSLVYSGVFALLCSVFTTHCHVLILSQANLLLFALLISFCLFAFIFPWFSYSIFICVFGVFFFFFCINRYVLNSARFYVALLASHQLFAYSSTALLLYCFPLLFGHIRSCLLFLLLLSRMPFLLARSKFYTCAKLFTGLKVR